MTIKEKNDKRQNLIDELSHIFISNDSENWIEKEPYHELTNLNAGVTIINIEPIEALSINEVEKFTVEEDVSGKTTTRFIRK